MYFNIKCIGKLPGPTNEFERSLVFETGKSERPKFDCLYIMYNLRAIYRHGSHFGQVTKNICHIYKVLSNEYSI